MYGTYRNKHNDREMTIDRMEIGDTGHKFWYAGEYEMFLDSDLKKHWVMISELGTPKPAMTDMEVLKLSLIGVREDCTEWLEDHGEISIDRDIRKGWIEALDFTIAQIGFLQDGDHYGRHKQRQSLSSRGE